MIYQIETVNHIWPTCYHVRPTRYGNCIIGLLLFDNVIFTAKFVIFFRDSINGRYNAYPYCSNLKYQYYLDIRVWLGSMRRDCNLFFFQLLFCSKITFFWVLAQPTNLSCAIFLLIKIKNHFSHERFFKHKLREQNSR